MAPRSSITKRWLLNSFGIIVVIMVAMVIVVSAAMHSFYYNSASQYIRTRAAAVSARLESAAADAGSDFNARLYELVQDFEYRDRIELMAIDSEGTVFLTSSGFVPQDTTMPDLAMARENGKAAPLPGGGRARRSWRSPCFPPFRERTCWDCGMWSPCRPSTGS